MPRARSAACWAPSAGARHEAGAGARRRARDPEALHGARLVAGGREDGDPRRGARGQAGGDRDAPGLPRPTGGSATTGRVPRHRRRRGRALVDRRPSSTRRPTTPSYARLTDLRHCRSSDAHLAGGARRLAEARRRRDPDANPRPTTRATQIQSTSSTTFATTALLRWPDDAEPDAVPLAVGSRACMAHSRHPDARLCGEGRLRSVVEILR